MRIALITSCITLACLLLLSACKSAADREREAEMMIPVPLEFDPTEHYEIARWWSNGSQLLRLDDNAAYVLYGTQNRYERPLERGRWAKENYATIWLEPYVELKHERQRVTVSKIDGRLALRVKSLALMFAIENPPATIEDAFIGTWSGPPGELRLNPDMRYAFAPAPPRTGRAAVAGHGGSWGLVKGAPLLKPDTPSVQPVELKFRREKDKKILVMAEGELQRTE